MLRILLVFILTLLALAGAAAVAYGTDPALALRDGGLQTIMLARRAQWAMIGMSLLACMALVVLVMCGRSRAWWLLILGPVMYLFVHRFGGEPWRRLAIADNPPFIQSENATYLSAQSPVIGLVLDDTPYAYPSGSLFRAPVVMHTEGDKRVIILYSPYAGRAQGALVDYTVKARELDIVSMPANAMLVYNARVGQFINAFTGTTPSGERPTGFLSSLELSRMTWQQWRTLHPDTRVLATPFWPSGENVAPLVPVESSAARPAAELRVCLVHASKPLAVAMNQLPDPGELINLSAPAGNLLVMREKATTKLKIYDRCVKGDLFPRFARKTLAKKPDVALVDLDTNSLWNGDLKCIDGFAKGERLRLLRIEEDLPWGTLHMFCPQVQLIEK